MLDYIECKTLTEAMEALAAADGTAKIFAGGTDLLIRIKEGKEHPGLLIDIKKAIPQSVEEIDGQLNIACTTTHSVLAQKLEKFVGVMPALKALTAAAKKIGGPQTRNRGTIGGNLVNASPASDLAPVLIALQASLMIQGKSHRREVPIEQFFLGPATTILAPDEILLGVKIPLQEKTKAKFFKLGTRSSLAISILNAAVAVEINPDRETFERVSIGLGCVGPTPLKALAAERFLLGRSISLAAVSQAARTACEDIFPISDIRASAEYRKAMVEISLKRLLRDVVGAAGLKL